MPLPLRTGPWYINKLKKNTQRRKGHHPPHHVLTIIIRVMMRMPSTVIAGAMYQYIDTWDRARAVCEHLRNGGFTVLAFDIEGVNLGRKGQVTLLQVAVDETCVYCFDVLLLGPALMGANFLGPLFHSPHVVKVCFDCRVDGDVLQSHFGLQIAHVYDIQVLYTLLFQASSDRFLKGLRHVLQSSGIIACPQHLQRVLAAKTKIKTLMSKNTRLFCIRPVTTELLQYCTADVVFLLRMYRYWHHMKPHGQIVALSMKRMTCFQSRPHEIPPRQMSLLDFPTCCADAPPPPPTTTWVSSSCMP